MPSSEDFLFSLPTLCDPGPALVDAPPPEGYRWLGEDDWRQIEFVARANLAHVQHELVKLAAFRSEHRSDSGWTDVYLRHEHPVPLSDIGLQFKKLPAWPLSGLAIGDESVPVHGGFALADGGDWFVYGQCTEEDHVVQLAVAPGRGVPSAEFAGAVVRLARSFDLLLVDWCAGALVDTSSTKSVLAWTGHPA